MAKNENATVEIDSIANIARKMTPEELDGYIHTRFANDLQFFSRIVNEINESHKIRKNDPRIKLLLGDIESFYNDLIADGHIKKDLSLLDVDKIKNMQAGQSREEYVELIHEAMVHTEADYIDVFRKLNRAYVNNYECLIDEHLILTAQKSSAKKLWIKVRY